MDFESKSQRSEAYLRLNPLGQVPTLVIDGRPYTESAALLMMLADRHPEARLAPPPGTPERNQWYQWLVFGSNAFGASYRNWFYPADLGATRAPAGGACRPADGASRVCGRDSTRTWPRTGRICSANSSRPPTCC